MTTPASLPPDPSSPTAVAAPSDTGPVYVVAGGDMVAVFTDLDSAAIEFMVMVGANLEPIVRKVRADQWALMRAGLRATVPGLVIVDLRDGDDQ
ncbi:hypothetical protein QLQ12_21480 [Actinoplanes sp. NEAU-A12]|uniref:Uncharacterized protein n=1 Tax=Actinoplanes sandaracinus TaxID=3045177 RepID=A0ABT6WN81_9ACTN|nr:hypothetical protein [Actinoplanes sandaracinus]MDI6101190.1 hypothetical protein [Actinoplanes sandaracinus]